MSKQNNIVKHSPPFVNEHSYCAVCNYASCACFSAGCEVAGPY